MPESELGSLDEKLCYYPRLHRAKNPKLVDIAPVIVPPLAEKEFEIDFLKRTWRFVYRAVSNATANSTSSGTRHPGRTNLRVSFSDGLS